MRGKGLRPGKACLVRALHIAFAARAVGQQQIRRLCSLAADPGMELRRKIAQLQHTAEVAATRRPSVGVPASTRSAARMDSGPAL